MTVVAVAGDLCTTTSVALAATWGSGNDRLLVDADPTGGDVAAWFDLPVSPSLSTVVTTVRDGGWPEIDGLVRTSRSGLRTITGPSGVRESARAVAEAGRGVAWSMAAADVTAIVDTGGLTHTPAAHPFVAVAAVTVVVHRQADQSSAAAAVRLRRLAEQVEMVGSVGTSLVVAVVGSAPFGLDEIERMLADTVGGLPVVCLPDDRLAAAVLAGRQGVSARRLARLPLMRAATDLAATTRSLIPQPEPAS